MKKLLTFFLLISFCFNLVAINNVSAYDEKASYVKELVIKKSELNKTKKGQQYTKAIDAFVEANNNNEKKLLELNSRLEKLIYSGNLKNDDLGNIIRYLNSKVNIAILNIKDEKINAILNSSISESDKKIVSDRILKLQSNLANSSKTLIEKFTKEFEEINNYSESGNLKISFDAENENIGKINSSIELNNYEAIINNFDSQLKGEFKALIEALPKGESEIKLQISSFIDFISKDGNIYLLLKNLNITDEKGINEIKEYLTKLEEIAKQNKYIKYEDDSTKMSLELIKSLNPANLSSDLKTAFTKPMFEAYKKEGEKYYIKPTKYACDKLKEFNNKFDPFNGKDCSESQYKEILTDLSKNGNLYITISGDMTTLGFEGIRNTTIEKNSGYITFTDKEVISFFYEVIPNQKQYPNEFFKINFKNKNSLNLDLYAEAGDVDVKLSTKLTTSNKFSFIDLNIKIPNFNGNLDLNNQIISGKFDYTTKGYNDSWQTIDKTFISGIISGKTDSLNKINELNIVYTGKDLVKNIQMLSGKLGITGSKFVFENKYNGDYSKNEITANGDFDKIFQLNNLNLKINAQNKNRTYNYNTWKYEYDDVFTPSFNLDLVINNKVVNCNFKIYELEKIVFESNSKGSYTSETFELKNNFKLNQEYLNSYLGEKLSGNLNFDIDLSNNKNNFYMLFDIISNNGKIVNLEIENKSIKNKGSVNINTPTNTIDYKDLFKIDDYKYNY